MSTSDSVYSLLWPSPSDETANSSTGPQRYISDLNLKEIVDQLNPDPRLRHFTEALLYNLCDDPQVINYRLDILDDLLANASVAIGMKKLLPQIQKLARYRENRNAKGLHDFQQVAWRLETLSIYVECIQELHRLLSTPGVHLLSDGLKQLNQYLDRRMEQPDFVCLVHDLPDLKAALNDVTSITIGINLDQNLRPCEAVVLEISNTPYKRRPLFSQLLGWASSDDYAYGIGPFRSIFKTKPPISALEDYLFRDLDEVFRATTDHIASVMARYTRDETLAIVNLEPAIDFYLGAISFISKMKSAGFSLTRPVVAPKETRQCTIESLYDVSLALSLLRQGRDANSIVTSSITFNDDGRIFILTGPNQGGKTTFTRAVGVSQVLMQAGIYVPGTYACISPVDGIYTHFLEEEKVNSKEGRLGEESRRLSEIFDSATKYSLVLLNESLSSTSPGESFYLTQDIVKAIRYLGARAIFATHLHDLAVHADQINTEVPGSSKVVSLVAGLDRETAQDGTRQRTYRIVAAPPQGESFARDIAEQYGISYKQLLARMAATSSNEKAAPQEAAPSKAM